MTDTTDNEKRANELAAQQMDDDSLNEVTGGSYSPRVPRAKNHRCPYCGADADARYGIPFEAYHVALSTDGEHTQYLCTHPSSRKVARADFIM